MLPAVGEMWDPVYGKWGPATGIVGMHVRFKKFTSHHPLLEFILKLDKFIIYLKVLK